MKRSYIRSFAIADDVGGAFVAAQERLRMSGSEIVNRLLMEWLLHSKIGALTPRSPVLPTFLPPTIAQRAKEIAANEAALRRQP